MDCILAGLFVYGFAYIFTNIIVYCIEKYVKNKHIQEKKETRKRLKKARKIASKG